MARFIYVVAAILFIGLDIVLTGPTQERMKRNSANEFINDAGEYANDQFQKLWGGMCLKESDCNTWISYCHKDQAVSIGECRLVWWFLLILAVLAALLLSSIISCLCCPCCFLYNACRNLCDCLCCCCKSNRGYTPART